MPLDETAELKAELAELKGIILTEIRHLGHDVKNLQAALQAFVPRHENDKTTKDQDGRIERLESTMTWAMRAIFGAWLAGLGTVWTFGKKVF